MGGGDVRGTSHGRHRRRRHRHPLSPSSPWMGANISDSRSLFQLSGPLLTFHVHLINWPYARRAWPGVCQGFLLLEPLVFPHQDGFEVDHRGLLFSINWSAG